MCVLIIQLSCDEASFIPTWLPPSKLTSLKIALCCRMNFWNSLTKMEAALRQSFLPDPIKRGTKILHIAPSEWHWIWSSYRIHSCFEDGQPPSFPSFVPKHLSSGRGGWYFTAEQCFGIKMETIIHGWKIWRNLKTQNPFTSTVGCWFKFEGYLCILVITLMTPSPEKPKLPLKMRKRIFKAPHSGLIHLYYFY